MKQMIRVENIIYIYGAICFSLILFNLVTICVNKRRKKELEKKDKNFDNMIHRQIERIKAGVSVEEDHLKKMEQLLHRIGNLVAFEETMDKVLLSNESLGKRYLKEFYPVFIKLSRYYRKKDTIYLTYFVTLVRKYKIIYTKKDERLIRFLLDLLDSKSVSCRECALEIFYEYGDVELVMKALHYLDRGNVYWHPKLVHDGLLGFNGNKKNLIKAIWRDFDEFHSSMQVTLLNYLRLSDWTCSEAVLKVLKQKGQDDEVCFACIRYLGKYYYEPAHPVLLSFVENEEDRRWEYAAIAAGALKIYKGRKTISALCKATDSKSWYVRNNAACSLQEMGLPYVELVKVLEENSKYAREMMMYWMNFQEIRKEEKRR